MKAKIIIELEEDYVNFIIRETPLTNADELKGFLRGTISKEDGIKSIQVEVEK